MLEVDQTDSKWDLRLEGRILDGLDQEQALSNEESTHFLQLFEKIKIEFLDEKGATSQVYMPTIWQKNKSTVGASFDCIRVARDFIE